MRTRVMTGAVALLFASAILSVAQDRPLPGPATGGAGGTIEVGGRFTSTDGDEARYERYRDLRNGANVNLEFHQETESWTLDVEARNVAYRDGRYRLSFNSRRLQLSLLFDQTPLNYAYYTKTPYECTAGSCTLDPGLRAAVQAGAAVGIPNTTSQLAEGSAYSAISSPFDLKSRRDTISAQARISATDHLDFLLDFKSYERSGNMPWGASFAFNNTAELPLVIDNRETDISFGVEWASHQGMFHLAYQRSKFDQEIPFFSFDNPQLATDFCQSGISGQAPDSCYDPRGYLNGNGPAFGRMAQPPSWTLDTFSWAGMVKLPGRTTANASVVVGRNRQKAELIPWTTNGSVASAAVYAAFPELEELPRETADMRVGYTSATMNVRSRPHKWIGVSARYRYHGRSDYTRPFDAVEYVRFDAVPEETGGVAEPFDYGRNSLDLTASFSGIPRRTIRVGYGIDRLEHGVRATSGWQDETARVSFDAIGCPYLTMRASYEHTRRDAVGLSLEALEHAGMQPAARFYDEASRTRQRGVVSADLTPLATIGINFSAALGRDDYDDEDQEFGLMDNRNTAFTVGLSYAPNARVNVGVDYGRESYSSLQRSRNANPAPDPQWTDPSFDWELDNDETVNSVSFYAKLLKALPKTDIRVGYEYADSDQAFVHSGPRIDALAAPTASAPTGSFTALPNVTSKWHRASIDLRYHLSERIGVGVSYLYEKLDVEDFATINTAGPQTLPRTDLGAQSDSARFDWFGGLITGYAARPYTGQTGIVRLFYEF